MFIVKLELYGTCTYTLLKISEFLLLNQVVQTVTGGYLEIRKAVNFSLCDVGCTFSISDVRLSVLSFV
jgi:hypothetical protein